jgi:hypothetical protein
VASSASALMKIPQACRARNPLIGEATSAPMISRA